MSCVIFVAFRRATGSRQWTFFSGGLVTGVSALGLGLAPNRRRFQRATWALPRCWVSPTWHIPSPQLQLSGIFRLFKTELRVEVQSSEREVTAEVFPYPRPFPCPEVRAILKYFVLKNMQCKLTTRLLTTTHNPIR